jgi:hypothetical protein
LFFLGIDNNNNISWLYANIVCKTAKVKNIHSYFFSNILLKLFFKVDWFLGWNRDK